LVQVAKAVADAEWLGVWVTVTGSLTSLAMLNTTICTSSRAIQSMGALGFFPKFLSKLHSKFKTVRVLLALRASAASQKCDNASWLTQR